MSASIRGRQPVPPPNLIEACRKGECVLYAGGGLSAPPGGPTSRRFLKSLLEWSVKNKFIGKELAQSFQVALLHDQITQVADGIASALQDHRDALEKYLGTIFSKKFIPHRVEYDLIRKLPFAAVITSNLDGQLEETYTIHHPGSVPGGNLVPRVYTPADQEQLFNSMHLREFFILKLYGTLQRPETIIIAQTQLEDALRENVAFSQFMESLFFSRTLLFIGTGLPAIENYLKSIGLKRVTNPREHFALVAVEGRAWEPAADSLERRYGIKVLPFNADKSYSNVPAFLDTLLKEVRPAGSPKGAAQAEQEKQKPFLKSVKLESIGPFDHLELNFDRSWNILLGDNGVGKSNILKAIALALTGSDASSFAGRLIKSGKTNSQIFLETNGNSYMSEIYFTSTGAMVSSNPPRPLESEGWLAMGFPPLRTVSWNRPKAPEAETKGRPTPEDLLPIIVGAPDPRLDKLKQWLVNLDYWIKNEREKRKSNGETTEGRYERLRKEFFKVVGVLTEGLTIEFKEVKPQTNEVTVITDDGEVPLEAISQGTTSLIGWVGILLQRLYEIYGEEEADPTKKYALVLMDEIDAHLHPAWQQSLIRKLRTIFPNVQFIATTHSPLIVGGLPSEQVFRFVRDDDGRVVQQPVNPQMMLGRADQILTGDLFGLKTTLDSITQEEIENYKRLLGKSKRTEPEQKEFERVRDILRFRIPMPAESATDREAQKQARDALIRQVSSANVKRTTATRKKKTNVNSRSQKQSPVRMKKAAKKAAKKSVRPRMLKFK